MHDGSILLVLGVVGARMAQRLRRREPVAPRAAVAALAAGGVAWVLGRTDGPLCDPDSLLQPHALWHALAAVAAAAALAVPTTGRSAAQPRR